MGVVVSPAAGPPLDLEDWFDQPSVPRLTYVRVAGAVSSPSRCFAVMVVARDDAWWWAWAFAVATGLCGTITTLHAAFGVPDDAGSLLWWLFAVTSWSLTASIS